MNDEAQDQNSLLEKTDSRPVHAEVHQALPPRKRQAGLDPYFPSVDEAVDLNQAVHDEYGQDWAGIRAPNELESALNRAKQHYYYGEGSDQERLATAAAKLAYGVGMNQPFGNGNKRTDFWLTRHFLNENGLGHIAPYDTDDEEFADHLIGHGEGTHSEGDTIDLFRQRLGVPSRQANILDEIHDTLDPRVWDHEASPEPTLKKEHSDFLWEKILTALDSNGYDGMDRWLSLVFTGSLTTYQYSNDSDVDISLFVDVAKFPEWSRAEMIGVMISECDGTILPGTTFPLQCFVVPPEIKKEDLYKPGLRSGYDLATDQWIVPPDKSRVHDVEKEMNQSYTIALENADKMDRLLRYEPDKAIQFWHQIHRRRQRDHRKGRGDYSPSNITYKMLANRGLFPKISEVSGEYIAKIANEPPKIHDPGTTQWDTGYCGEYAMALKDLYPHLQLGAYGTKYDDGWVMDHMFAHDGTHLYDVTGKRPLQPYLDDPHTETDLNWDYDPRPPEFLENGGEPAVEQAKRLIRNHRVAQYEDRLASIAQAYHAAPMYDPQAHAAWDELAEDSRQRAEQIRRQYNFSVTDEDDPYANAQEMFDDMARGNFVVSRANSEHPIWTPEQNVDFRTVHDVLGHGVSGADFSWEGENQACAAHSPLLSPAAQRALFTECIAQTAYANHYGGFGPQKTVFLDDHSGLRAAAGDDGTLCHRHIRSHGRTH